VLGQSELVLQLVPHWGRGVAVAVAVGAGVAVGVTVAVGVAVAVTRLKVNS
jgi:hypothetical protein